MRAFLWLLVPLLIAAPIAAQEKADDAAEKVGTIWRPNRDPVSDEASAEASAKAIAAAADTEAPAVMVDGKLTDREGRTLYRFDRDRREVSTCHRICAQLWPPYEADTGDSAGGDFTIVERADGQRQWAWRGHPMYYWVHDKKPGDVTGDEVNEVWHVLPEALPTKR